MSTLEKYLNGEFNPISGGNKLQVIAKQEAIDDFAKSNLKEIVNSTSSTSYGYNYNFYQILNFEADYWTGKYVINSPDYYLNSIVMQTIRNAFFNGIGGFMMDIATREYKAITIKNLKMKYNLISDFEYTEDTTNESQILNNPNIKWKKATKEQLQTTAICRWGLGWRGQGAWVWLNPYVKTLESAYKQIYSYIKLSMKKIVYNVQNPSVAKTELEIFNDISPFIVNVQPDFMDGEVLKNKFEEWGLDPKDNLMIFKLIEETQKTYGYLLGRNTNVDGKLSGERNLTSEIQVSQNNLDQIQRTTDQFINDFIKQVEEITGVDIQQLDKEIDNGTNGIY